MQLFYDSEIVTGFHPLREGEARHAIQVLRRRVGDQLKIVDGKGGWYQGEIIEATKKKCLLEVEKVSQEDCRSHQQITLLFGPPKTADRLEWLLEKATEIGVDVFQPVITEHSERRKLKPDRLQKIIESAMKQSLQAWLPTLKPIARLEEVLPLSENEKGLMAYIDEKVNAPLIQPNHASEQFIRILIGPEGGFSAQEAEMAATAGYHLGSLGQNRLRAETAAIVALAGLIAG